MAILRVFFFFSRRMFLQYVDNGVLHLTKGFISRLVEGRQFMYVKQLVRKPSDQHETSPLVQNSNQGDNRQE